VPLARRVVLDQGVGVSAQVEDGVVLLPALVADFDGGVAVGRVVVQDTYWRSM